MSIESLPEDVIEDIEKAKSIILDAGAKEIFLFGSFATGEYSTHSDIDLAATGIDKSKFFAVYGKLLCTLNHRVDFICLDYESSFSKQLLLTGTLLKVA